MERVDKIFTILSGMGLVALLVWQRNSLGPALNESALPNVVADRGPSYLLSNLPARRNINDFVPVVSYSEKFAS